MSFFKRLFTMASSEAHSALDSLEDPIKMASQGIRDLRNDLQDSLKGLAEVKAQSIRAKREYQRQRDVAADYEQKAMMLVKRAESGQISAADADRLATEALNLRDQAIKRATELSREVDHFDTMTGKLEANINALKSQITKYENELSTLKARAQVGKATRKLNEQLASVDSSGTIAMLERMRDKVHEEEALAQAYGDIADTGRSIDSEIDTALAGSADSATPSASLEALKARMAAAPKPETVTVPASSTVGSARGA